MQTVLVKVPSDTSNFLPIPVTHGQAELIWVAWLNGIS